MCTIHVHIYMYILFRIYVCTYTYMYVSGSQGNLEACLMPLREVLTLSPPVVFWEPGLSRRWA